MTDACILQISTACQRRCLGKFNLYPPLYMVFCDIIDSNLRLYRSITGHEFTTVATGTVSTWHLFEISN
ncbi:hypothetical protein TNCV_932331, partial [Trichonephila clavipes]